MQKVEELYNYLHDINKNELFIDNFPNVHPQKKFKDYVNVLNNILETLSDKLEIMKNKKRNLLNQREELTKLKNLNSLITSTITPLGEDNIEGKNYDELNKKIKKENCDKVYNKLLEKNESITKKFDFVKEELNLTKRGLECQKKILKKLRVSNRGFEKNIKMEEIKDELTQQIELNNKMKEKILLISYLDETLGLDFKSNLDNKCQRKLLENILREKTKENEIIENFQKIEKLQKKSMKK